MASVCAQEAPANTHARARARPHVPTHPQVLLSGLVGAPADLDLAKWAAWLNDNGYDDKAGWAKIVAGAKEK